jgi:catechol 2,3-dioxygenase-like lactoylglutathione lyase family enzyme
VKVLGLHHVNINVRDVDEAVGFYTSIGFEQVPRPDFGLSGAWLQMGTHQLHLSASDNPLIDPVQHFALAVDDLDLCTTELAGLGVEVARGRVVDGAGRQAFFRDPTGNLIELNQPLA